MFITPYTVIVCDSELRHWNEMGRMKMNWFEPGTCISNIFAFTLAWFKLAMDENAMKIQCQHICHVDLKTHFTRGITLAFLLSLKHWIRGKYSLHFIIDCSHKIRATSTQTSLVHATYFQWNIHCDWMGLIKNVDYNIWNTLLQQHAAPTDCLDFSVRLEFIAAKSNKWHSQFMQIFDDSNQKCMMPGYKIRAYNIVTMPTKEGKKQKCSQPNWPVKKFIWFVFGDNRANLHRWKSKA